jgi:cobalt/nickel transport system permease protein
MLREPFAFGTSFVHRLDPRVRLLSAGFFSIVVALASTFPVLVAALLVSCSVALLARLPLREIAKRMALLNGFMLLLWVVLPLTFQGPVAFPLGPLLAYRAGIVMAAQITLKSNAILLMLIGLVATMPLSALGHALHGLRVPPKIVHLLLMTYRYVFVIDHEYRRLMRAAHIRGFRPKTNLHTYKTYAYIVGMLLVRSSMRAERVYKAMLCRGFKHRFYSLHEYEAGPKEWLFGFALMGMVGVMIWFEWGSGTGW